MSKIVDTSKNGTILPEPKMKRVAMRLNNATILHVSAAKIKKHGGKENYIKHYLKELRHSQNKF